MDRLNLVAEERKIIGKKVKNLRSGGILPGNVFGKGVESEAVSVDGKTFLKTFKEAGSTGVIDLKIGSEKVRPVMVKDVAYNVVTGEPLHIDFYQVDLSKAVTVPVPLVLVGEDPEKVHLGEAIILQTLNEVQVEALPTDLVENIEVDITTLKEIDDAITVGQLNYDREKLKILADPEEIVVKLAPAVSAEMEALLEEQAAETAAASAEATTAEEAAAEAVVEEAAPAEATAGKEGEEKAEGVEGEEASSAAGEQAEQPQKAPEEPEKKD